MDEEFTPEEIEGDQGCEGEFRGEIKPKDRTLTLTAVCDDCGRPIRMVTDDAPAIEIEDFVESVAGFPRFRWEHDD